MLPLGVSSWFGYDLPLETRLDLIVKAGFGATCLWLGEEENMVWGGHADTIPKLMHERGLKVDNVHAPYKNSNFMWSDSKFEQDFIKKELTGGLLFCSRHNIPIMVLHPVFGEAPPPPNRSGLGFFRGLVKMAEDRNVVIALENVFYTGNEHLEYLFSQIPSPNLGFCYDSSHDNIATVYQRKALGKWGLRLATTHLSDNLGIRDDHLIPGKGNIAWPEVMQQIPKSYIGALLLEIDNSEAAKELEPIEFLITAYAQLQKLADMLGEPPEF